MLTDALLLAGGVLLTIASAAPLGGVLMLPVVVLWTAAQAIRTRDRG